MHGRPGFQRALRPSAAMPYVHASLESNHEEASGGKRVLSCPISIISEVSSGSSYAVIVSVLEPNIAICTLPRLCTRPS